MATFERILDYMPSGAEHDAPGLTFRMMVADQPQSQSFVLLEDRRIQRSHPIFDPEYNPRC